MAKKKTEMSLVDSLSEFKELKNIDKKTMLSVLEDSFRNVLSKIYGSEENCEVIINDKRGDFEIYRDLLVVEDGQVEDENKEIELSMAKLQDEDIEVGEKLTETVDFNAFGRRAVINLRQALASKVLDIQKENFRLHFEERVGQIITAEVYQVWKREALLLDEEGNELNLPKDEQIPGDFFRKGDSVRALILRVDNDNNNPKVILSRNNPNFLKCLLEQNVPEIADGLITIKSVARIPGERAKIAVESYDDRIDPVGACVGVNGSRVKGIVRELKGENIDVTTYTSNSALFVQRALSPAKISGIAFGPEPESADEQQYVEVFLRPEEVPLAIGKNASNLKLAAMLTGYKIEVFRDDDSEIEEDIYIDEFSDEIEKWVIDLLKEKGCTTAKAVLKKEREELLELTDLEEETIDHILAVLSSEFSDEEDDTNVEKELEEDQE